MRKEKTMDSVLLTVAFLLAMFILGITYEKTKIEKHIKELHSTPDAYIIVDKSQPEGYQLQIGLPNDIDSVAKKDYIFVKVVEAQNKQSL